MAVEPLSFNDIDKMSTSQLRAELRKRNVDCTDVSRKTLTKRLKEAVEDNIAVKCYSGSKCESGSLYWDIDWNAIECRAAMGPGYSIRSAQIKVGDYDWYAELFPKGELQKSKNTSNTHNNSNNNSNNNNNNNNNNNSTQHNVNNLTLNPNNLSSSSNSIPNNSQNNLSVSSSLIHHNRRLSSSQSSPSSQTSVSSTTTSSAPALFLSICKTSKSVQMRFTVQLYRPSRGCWSEAVISSLRVFVRNNHGWGWKEWMDYDDLKREYAADGKLKLKITIDVYGPVNTSLMNDKVTFNIPNELSLKMNHLFQSGRHKDINIVVSGYTNYYNKCKALITSNSKASGTGIGSLDDDDDPDDDLDPDLDDDNDHNHNDNDNDIDNDGDEKDQSKSNRKSSSVGDDDDDDIDVNNNNNNRRGSSSVISAPPYKKRKLNTLRRSHSQDIATYDCIDDHNQSVGRGRDRDRERRSNSNNNNDKSSTIEKISAADLGIDEDIRGIHSSHNHIKLEIPAHRCILANFSPIFASMFKHQFKENIDSAIYIGKDKNDDINSNSSQNDDNIDNDNDITHDNIDPYVFRGMIQYIYTENIDKDIDRTLLMMLADKYQIQRLVMICLQDLTNQMNTSNVATILLISHKFNQIYPYAYKVKRRCLDYICKHLHEVMETTSYKKACANDSQINNIILKAFANQQYNLKSKSRNNANIIGQKRRFHQI